MADINLPPNLPMPGGPGSPEPVGPGSPTSPLPTPPQQDTQNFKDKIETEPNIDLPIEQQIESKQAQIEMLQGKLDKVQSDIADLEALPPNDPNRSQLLPDLKKDESILQTAIQVRETELSALKSQAGASDSDAASVEPANKDPGA